MSPKTKKLCVGSVLAAFGVMSLMDGLTSRYGGEGAVFVGVLCLIPAVYFLKQVFMATDGGEDSTRFEEK
jgi:hypothetical protein